MELYKKNKKYSFNVFPKILLKNKMNEYLLILWCSQHHAYIVRFSSFLFLTAKFI